MDAVLDSEIPHGKRFDFFLSEGCFFIAKFFPSGSTPKELIIFGKDDSSVKEDLLKLWQEDSNFRVFTGNKEPGGIWYLETYDSLYINYHSKEGIPISNHALDDLRYMVNNNVLSGSPIFSRAEVYMAVISSLDALPDYKAGIAFDSDNPERFLLKRKHPSREVFNLSESISWRRKIHRDIVEFYRGILFMRDVVEQNILRI